MSTPYSSPIFAVDYATTIYKVARDVSVDPHDVVASRRWDYQLAAVHGNVGIIQDLDCVTEGCVREVASAAAYGRGYEARIGWRDRQR